MARLPAGASTVEAVAGQRLGDPGRRVVLLVGGFRVGVDPVRQLEDLGTGRLDGRRQASLGFGIRFGGGGGRQGGHGSS